MISSGSKDISSSSAEIEKKKLIIGKGIAILALALVLNRASNHQNTCIGNRLEKSEIIPQLSQPK